MNSKNSQKKSVGKDKKSSRKILQAVICHAEEVSNSAIESANEILITLKQKRKQVA